MGFLIDKYNQVITMKAITCCEEKCGVTFGVPDKFDGERRDDHGTFYCPNGHSQYYPGKSDLEKEREKARKLANLLRIEKELKEEIRDDLYSERRSKAAIKGHATRVKKRIANGVCPCCNRTFNNLHNHMKNQHPEYIAEGVNG